MDRRQFLKVGALIPGVGSSGAALAQTLFAPKQAQAWRTFEITTRVDLKGAPSGTTRAWLPVPSVNSGYQKTLDSDWSGNAGTAKMLHDETYGAGMLYAEWPASVGQPVVELRSRVQTRDRAVDFTARPTVVDELSPSARLLYTSPTEHMPLDGIVRQTTLEAIKDARTDLDKAKAIYGWVVDNTFRDPKVRGCGMGDVKTLLRSGTLGGKCADLNGLYVCLCRAAGLPARDVYGVRVAKSAFGYRSLGAGTENITRSQHCRAEVYLEGWGWVPADPADVRKVVLEERTGPIALDDPLVQAVRPKLFGAWEMNWLAFNTAGDITLPHATQAKLTFLMYPQAETAAGRLDSLDPDNFRYTITAKEIKA
jgi:transglutaminase-like putative cysteine protease